ncbi:MAG: hypothetical protein D8M58_17395 [Calditrichaeota bacterium]|nr:MAG: hypothetical protein DWQ03_01310 [Calditrichota bacterium]MBL1207182.1 hypothetical protein [Calditrichota bacterium]NOG47015.1 hypothetical protein [Calditrichota bacterium]
MNNKTAKHIIIALLVLGTLGGLLFFPVQLSDGYTCFYHRIFDADFPVLGHEHSDNLASNGDHHGTGMMDVYMGGYAFIWWGSLVLVSFSIYSLKRRNTQRAKTLN